MGHLVFIALLVVLLLGSGGYALLSGSLPKGSGHSSDGPSVSTVLGTRLDLSGKGLAQVPGYVFARADVEVLDLSRNNLSGALPAEVRRLSRLTTLDLSDNHFTGVPAEVGQLAQLEVLDLSNNPITGLPHELGNLKNLRTLDLSGTDYSEYDLAIIRESLGEGVDIKTDK